MAWFASEGILFKKAASSGETLELNNRRFAVKFSTLWTNGFYRFQQIRMDDYDFLICFGLSPFKAHCWIFAKELAITNATPQHRAEKGAEYWLTVDPNQVPKWAAKSGGTLEEAKKVLEQMRNSND
jgi:hypothetical protein